MPEDLGPVVRLSITDADDLTEDEKREIAEWLRFQAASLLQPGVRYDHCFVPRYLYVPDHD